MSKMQILSRAPKLEAFRMASSRVGFDGGVALANSMTSGKTHYADVQLLWYPARASLSLQVLYMRSSTGGV